MVPSSSRPDPPNRDPSLEGDAEKYERACLEATRRALSDFPSSHTRVGDVRLVGEHPETRIVLDLVGAQAISTSWSLWGDDFGVVGEYGRASPEMVADEIMVFAYEHVR